MEQGKGIPKEREVNRRRDVCECRGDCVCESIGVPSMLVENSGGNGTGPGCVVYVVCVFYCHLKTYCGPSSETTQSPE